MLVSIGRFFRQMQISKSGNAMILVAMGMPALIGGSGLAVDTAQWYMWKQEMQYAVDQAAVAGAWARSDTATSSTYSTRATQEYTLNVQKVDEFDAAPTVTLENYNGGTANAVRVVSTATKNLPFSSFLTERGVTVSVSATASVVPGVPGTSTSTTVAGVSACLVALDPSASGAFTVGGSADGSVPCGGATLSSDSTAAIQENGNPPVQFGLLAARGGIESSLLNNVGNDPKKLKANQSGLTDPYGTIATPTGSGIAKTYSCPSGGGIAYPNPGTYSNISIACETHFNAGIYVINGSIDFSSNKVVVGTDVMFVMTQENNMSNINSNSSITLSGITKSTLINTYGYSDTGASKLAGMILFDPFSTSQIKWNGNSVSILNGTLYMPGRQLWFNGTAAVSGRCMMLVGRTLMFTGNLDLSSFCQTSGSAIPSIRDDVTTTTTTAATPPQVRLVG